MPARILMCVVASSPFVHNWPIRGHVACKPESTLEPCTDFSGQSMGWYFSMPSRAVGIVERNCTHFLRVSLRANSHLTGRVGKKLLCNIKKPAILHLPPAQLFFFLLVFNEGGIIHTLIHHTSQSVVLSMADWDH